MKNIKKDNFLEWFVGFTDAEGCFKIKPKYRDYKNVVHSFYFEFEIHLHIDDLATLNYICDTLGIGKIYTRGKTCNFIVGNTRDLKKLLEIFDNYSLIGIKYLDYQDFKLAFLSYINREDKLTSNLIDKILELKNRMNTNRIKFEVDYNIKITPFYLLGLIEGDGTFSVSRDPIRPVFQMLFTASQEYLLLHIKKFLINNLELDYYSKWNINNSSVISINKIKAKGNAKATVLLEIRDISLLHNYFLPFLDKLNFISKKSLDFKDFKIICSAIYKGVHKIDSIKDLILKLTYSMNDYRLTTYKGKIPRQQISSEEIIQISSAPVIFEHLSDGRVINTSTGIEDYSIFSNIFIIYKSNKEEVMVKTLKDAAKEIGIYYTTLSKKLTLNNDLFINECRVKRIRVFI
jgi:hypothetical protein